MKERVFIIVVEEGIFELRNNRSRIIIIFILGVFVIVILRIFNLGIMKD